ncbi:MAG: spore cortex biosynthesis protein YabQ, partial [Bacillota bacterium]|nr:spore cortex biosynthesis protein YabQ [Bacillota bacterium]
MEINLASQIYVFLWACAFGFAIGILYEIVRFMRIAGFDSYIHTFIQDVLFISLCAFLTFFFAVAMNGGRVRFFILLGETVGFFVYRFTVARLTEKIFSLLVKLFNLLFNLLKKPTYYVFSIGKAKIYRFYIKNN